MLLDVVGMELVSSSARRTLLAFREKTRILREKSLLGRREARRDELVQVKGPDEYAPAEPDRTEFAAPDCPADRHEADAAEGRDLGEPEQPLDSGRLLGCAAVLHV